MPVETELYELLGVSVTATEAEIRKAYRNKAMKHHPDKNPDDPNASQKFQEMAAAYEILSDPQSREAYDMYGMEGMARGGGGGGGGMDMDDIFATFFGGGGGGGGGPGMHFGFDFGSSSGGPRRRKGEDTTIPYSVTLEDLYNGKSVKMNMEKEVVCGVCHGSGAKGNAKPKKCAKCEGKGWTYIHTQVGPRQMATMRAACSECHGEGEKIREKERCKKCKGEKTVKEKTRQEIQIERGMPDRHRIVLAGAGDQQPGVPPGDVIFALRTEPHAAFERSGKDLLARVKITLSEALLGFSRILLTHLDGRGIRVASPPGTVVRPNETIVLRGEGMPTFKHPELKGDLFVVLEIEMPGPEWLARVDREALAGLLPPKKTELEPRPAVVDEAEYEQTELADVRGRSFPAGSDFFSSHPHGYGGYPGQFGDGGDEEDWVDEDEEDEEDEDGMGGAEPECRNQ